MLGGGKADGVCCCTADAHFIIGSRVWAVKISNWKKEKGGRGAELCLIRTLKAG